MGNHSSRNAEPVANQLNNRDIFESIVGGILMTQRDGFSKTESND